MAGISPSVGKITQNAMNRFFNETLLKMLIEGQGRADTILMIFEDL